MSPRRTIVATILSFAVAVSCLAQEFRNLEYDTDLIAPSVFKARRDSVLKEIGQDAIAVFFSAPERTRNADVQYRYRQDDNFYYLTGFPEPNAMLMLVPRGWSVQDEKDSSRHKMVNEILFVQQRNAKVETWTGRRFGPQGAMQERGLSYAMNNDKFKAFLPELLAVAAPATIYAPSIPSDANRELSNLLKPLQSAVDSQRAASREVKDPGSMIRRMRVIKSPGEIAMIAKACEISAIAHKQAMMSCEPGMHEYDLQAVYEYVYGRMGAEYTAYPCIVGSAENSVILHYETNRREIRNGDIIVADCGAEYHNYASDVTRTYPANGKFSGPQKAIYEIVLATQKACIDMLQPGVSFKDVSDHAEDILTDGLVKLGIMKTRERRELREFYNHGLGHPVGLDVHDVGRPELSAGMVYTIEPGIYIHEGAEGVDPKYYNIGVRIEDTILITENGHNVLSQDAPKEIKDIEAAMTKKGVGKMSLK